MVQRRLQHGESQHNVEGKIGGDSLLSTRGEKYAAALPQLIKEKVGDTPLTVSFNTQSCKSSSHISSRKGVDLDSSTHGPNSSPP